MAARTEFQVVSIVRAYLSSLGTDRMALIPGTVIAFGMNHTSGIVQAAVELARHEAETLADAPEAEILKEVGTVLSTAAMKLAVLTHSQPQTAER